MGSRPVVSVDESPKLGVLSRRQVVAGHQLDHALLCPKCSQGVCAKLRMPVDTRQPTKRPARSPLHNPLEHTGGEPGEEHIGYPLVKMHVSLAHIMQQGGAGEMARHLAPFVQQPQGLDVMMLVTR